jgi:hypothetical protein
MFRRSVENRRIINLIDGHGNHTCAVQEGRMNITSHKSVLAALENRASRYSNRGPTQGVDDNLVSWALDKTGTVDASFLGKCNENIE